MGAFANVAEGTRRGGQTAVRCYGRAVELDVVTNARGVSEALSEAAAFPAAADALSFPKFGSFIARAFDESQKGRTPGC
jgi:hypothetical protein